MSSEGAAIVPATAAAARPAPTHRFRSGPPSEHRVLDWERRSVPVVIVVSAVFMGSVSWLFLLDRPSRTAVVGIGIVVTTCWLYFLADFLVRLALARDRRWFLRARWPDVVLIVLTVVPHLHFLRVIALVIVVHHLAMRSLRNQVMVYTLFVTVVLVWGVAVNVLVVERHVRDSTIRTLGDAIWWAVTSVTTVGYGDTYPRTAAGRVLGGVLVVGGVALIGVWTASFANWLFAHAQTPAAGADADVGHSPDGPAGAAPAVPVEPDPAAARTAGPVPALDDAASPTALPADLLAATTELAREVRALRAELAELRDPGRTPPP